MRCQMPRHQIVPDRSSTIGTIDSGKVPAGRLADKSFNVVLVFQRKMCAQLPASIGTSLLL
jgi:hypothetical protein